MRVALAQINPVVGDIAGNCRKILHFASEARQRGAELAVFPELSLIGYPPKDLLLKGQFIEDNLRGLQIIASHLAGIEAIVGYADRNTSPVGRPLRNALALLRGGEVAGRYFKTLLPTYDVFDETRYFEPGPPDQAAHIVRFAEVALGLSICEDLWNDERLVARRLYHQNPIADLCAGGAQVLVNSSASPFVAGKHDFRLELFGQQARQFGRPLLYVNQVGGNDELIFDGNSVVFDSTGQVIAQAKGFEEDLLVVDVAAGSAVAAQAAPVRPSRGLESVYRALLLGLRDYVRKCGFKSVVLGLSGGIDSAVTAALAAAALGPDKVLGVALPSRYSSDHSIADARQLAQNLGIGFHLVSIKEVHSAYAAALGPTLAELAANCPPDQVTDQNLQARIRGAILMALSNRLGHLLLTTGNKSELATGYCTLYGDMCGGLAVISDVPKMMVYALAEFINQQAGRDLIPRNSITKVPSAELRPNQTDQDTLPPYDLLDAILERYIEQEQGLGQIVAAGFDAATVLRVINMVDRSEYKRRQAAPGLKVTSRAFGFGRRMPIAQNYQQVLPPRQ